MALGREDWREQNASTVRKMARHAQKVAEKCELNPAVAFIICVVLVKSI
jgi:hypothetical protein